MNLLTIDTSSNACSVALTSGDRLVAEHVVNQAKPLTSSLLEVVDTVLKGAGMTVYDLDGFGVALGPGSFTGLRVGVATIKGLALTTGKPVAGFSSLAMLAMNLPWAACPVCPMFDARKKEVYTALYDCRDMPQPLLADCVAPPADFLPLLTGPTIFVGDGALSYRDLIVARLGENARFAPLFTHQPRASMGALLARESLASGKAIPVPALVPVYIRPSEAELAKMHRENV